MYPGSVSNAGLQLLSQNSEGLALWTAKLVQSVDGGEAVEPTVRRLDPQSLLASDAGRSWTLITDAVAFVHEFLLSAFIVHSEIARSCLLSLVDVAFACPITSAVTCSTATRPV